MLGQEGVLNRRLAHRPDIEGLRAIAVGAVLLFHVDLSALPGGYVGVDIFFVISGFLITRLIVNDIQNERFDFGTFYTRRARRLFPAMIATVAATLLGGVLLFAPGDLERVGGSALAATLSFSNIFFWTEKNYFDAASQLKPLLHTWSLGVEEQFYLVWPAMLVFAHRWFSMRVVIIAIVAATLISFGLNYAISDKPSALFFLLPARVFEFGIGAVLFVLMRDRRLPKLAEEGSLLVGIAMMITACVLYTESTPFPLVYALLPCIGAALAIAGGQAPITGRVLSNPVATYIGKISYSLYLAHWPLVVFYKYLKEGAPLTGFDQLVLIALTFLCAEMLFRFVETPFRRPRDVENTGRLSAPAFGLASAAMAIPLVVVSAMIWANNGWMWRISKEAQAIVIDRGQVRSAANFRGQTENPSHKVVLVGDSHAVHYKAMLSDYFTFVGVKMENLGAACAPLPRMTVRGSGARIERQCTELSAQLLETTPDYDGIILAARWSTYTETRYPERDAKNKHDRRFVMRPYEDGEAFMTVAHSRASFDESLSRYVEETTAMGIPVMIIGEVPPHGAPFWRCATRPRWWSDRACTPYYTQDQSRRDIAHAEQLFARFADNPLVTVVSVVDILCEAGDAHCSPYFGGKMVYFDSNHLTYAGGRLMGRRLHDDYDRFYRNVTAKPSRATFASDTNKEADRNAQVQ